MNIRRYVYAKTKIAKSQVVHSIVEELRQSSAVGGFVKRNHITGRYMAVSDYLAREKVGHALRDALNVIKRHQRDDPYEMELDKQENVVEAEQAIFKSLNLYRGRQETEMFKRDLNASLDISQYESSSAAPVFSL